jgi:outer membrane protein OmpA-like peptidoglycan-associated protein
MAHLGASLTPVHWLTLELAMPFALLNQGELADGASVSYAGDAAPSPSAPGVGDLRIGALFRPINTPTLSVIAGARFWAPMGSEAAYLSDARARFEVDLGLAGEGSRALYGCTLGLSPMFFGQRIGDRVGAACALHARVTGSISLGVEPTFNLQWVGNKNGDADVGVLVEPLATGRLRLGGFSVGLGAGPGFGRSPGTAQFRGVLALAYTGQGRPENSGPSEALDSDFDGVLDAEDACPHAAGPAERKGCPLLDADGDRIADSDDACPNEAGAKHTDPRAHGCPDGDNDKLPDPIDTCPMEPGPAPEGCPRFARLAEGTFTLSFPLDFKGGSASMTPDQEAALREIAATMRANPKLEQVSISLGTKGTSAALSDHRAQALLVILNASSLDSNRYEVVLSDDRAGSVKVRLIR